MKTKTIKRVLKNKMDAWVESVKDDNIKKAIKRSAIVTGGSIASMLLREDVNDYDVYFKNKEDLRIVCQYYIKGTNVDILDGANKPEPKRYEDEDGNETTGSTNGLDAAYKLMDVDQLKLWFGTAPFLERETKKQTEENDKGTEKFRPIYFTQNAITLSDKVQIVVRFNGEIEDIHKNYDFVHATNSYDYYKEKLHLRPEALECLLTKELRYIGSKYPLTSIIRTKKFIQRNWTINAGQYLKIMWQVAELDLTDIDVLSEQLAGVDVAYFSHFIEAMRTQDKEKMTYDYISKIVDKIFQ